MEKNDLIVVAGVGGALALILWLASKNQNKADEIVMPYGWGSFQSGQYLTSLGATQPAATIPEPVPIEPPVGTRPPGGYPPGSSESDFLPVFKFPPGGNWVWPPFDIPTPINPPEGIYFQPIEANPIQNPNGVISMASVIKPVTGEKVI